ncbi:MAG: hypothetical protein NVSMB6_01160 [Burkholderiaceae bacterium]
MRIAVVGGGLSGLCCAHQLQSLGHAVVVYEKSRAVGGRMSTRQNELGGFDDGAQYFTATTKSFRKVLAQWTRSGWTAAWKPRLVVLDHGRTTRPSTAAQRRQRWVAQPGMHWLGMHLASELKVRTEQRVRRIERINGHWLLSVQSATVPIDATAGPYDAVVVAVPADQAEALLEAEPNLLKQALPKLAPCWTLLLAFPQPLGLPYDGAWVNNSRLGWIAQDASKPQRRPGEHWVAQASGAWSKEHLEDDPERVKGKLLTAFHEATDTHMQPVFAGVHCWRYSQATQPIQADCLWDDQRGLGACGDWFGVGLDGMGRIENACLSGMSLAERIGKS